MRSFNREMTSRPNSLRANFTPLSPLRRNARAGQAADADGENGEPFARSLARRDDRVALQLLAIGDDDQRAAFKLSDLESLLREFDRRSDSLPGLATDSVPSASRLRRTEA